MSRKISKKLKQQLIGEEVVLEGFGGDVPIIEVSAKNGMNIKELLDLILLVSDLHPKSVEFNKKAPLKAIVIESKQDPKAGAKASIVIKNGEIKIKDDITTGKVLGRVRSLISDTGNQLKEASYRRCRRNFGF